MKQLVAPFYFHKCIVSQLVEIAPSLHANTIHLTASATARRVCDIEIYRIQPADCRHRSTY